MKIKLNGQTRELLNPFNLRVIIDQSARHKLPVVAELNGEIIKNPDWEKTILKDGDALELVSFVGGGS